MINLLSNIFSAILSIFKSKQDAAAAESNLQQSRVSLISSLVAAHTFIADFGISLIIASCALCLFHDLVLVRVFGWNSAPMATQEVWQLVGLFFGATIVHANRKRN